ncbi:MAG: hypothetical protein AAB897_00775 [Patescibacteria group bacterium]
MPQSPEKSIGESNPPPEKHIKGEDLEIAKLYQKEHPDLDRDKLGVLLEREGFGADHHKFSGCSDRAEYINLVLDKIFLSPEEVERQKQILALLKQLEDGAIYKSIIGFMGPVTNEEERLRKIEDRKTKIIEELRNLGYEMYPRE